MVQRLFGIETEYAVSAWPAPGAQPAGEGFASCLLDLARRRRHLPGLHSSGIFLPNGSRFYVDCGAHPEFATPECANPWDVCRYLQAGEQMLLGLSGQLTALDRGVERALIFKGNVDYMARTTWGCHESYLYKAMDQGEVSRQIIPHLVSRVLFTGAGGWNAYSAGIEFLVSPRVAHLCSVVSGNSTDNRGIFHTRDESLCGNGYRRLHILCGESLCGETGTWLKVATTALVVALIEAQKRPGDAMRLGDPLDAMRAFAADPSCRCTVKLADGRQVTALDIQYHYLKQAEEHLDAGFMPPWADETCRRWRAILDLLREGAPLSASLTLDWAIKRALFENHIRSRNMTFKKLADWTQALGELPSPPTRASDSGQSSPEEAVADSKSPSVASRERLTRHLKKRGMPVDELEAVLALRLELFEIDRRFSLLGEEGIFTTLDRQGVLDHHVPGVDNIPHALEYPPAIGRAALRGGCIRNVAGRKGRYAAEWDGVVDHQTRQRLNLSDPWCESAKWEALPTSRGPTGADADLLFRRGLYADVVQYLRGELHEFLESPELSSVSDIESLVFSHARLGQRSEALALLESTRRQMDEFHHIALSMSVLSNGLLPALREMEPFVSAGDRLKPGLLEGQEECNDYTRFIYLQSKALWLLHKGVQDQAERILVTLLGEASNRGRPRMYNRTRCTLAELLRLRGRSEEALQLVRTAIEEHRAGRLAGDLADHSLPMLAKLTPDTDEAQRCLHEAQTLQSAHRNRLGLAKVLCIRARRLPDPAIREDIQMLRSGIPALRDCPVAEAIITRWQEWVAPPPTDPRDYWGL